MELKDWKLVFKKNWDTNFKKFDKDIQKKILKKLNQMKQPLQARGLKTSKTVVEEVGQHRIAFYQNIKKKPKRNSFHWKPQTIPKMVQKTIIFFQLFITFPLKSKKIYFLHRL